MTTCTRSTRLPHRQTTLRAALIGFSLLAASGGNASALTQVEDVAAAPAPQQQTVQAFVASVAAPAPGRKPAAWRAPICVGVTGIRSEAAQALADRILDWGYVLGLTTGQPGCTPNIFVVVTDNGNTTAQALVRSRPREFRTGASGVNRNDAALTAFQTSERRIRWWHISLPVNSDTGAPIVRLPGQRAFMVPEQMTSPQNFGDYNNSAAPSRIAEQSRDDLKQAIIVVEIAAFDDASFTQIADYVAMAALAQIDPDSAPPAPSILHLFSSSRAHEPSLSRWDRAYLEALYAPSTASAGGGVTQVAETMAVRLQSTPGVAEPAP